MPTIEFTLQSEYVELCNLLKLTGLADSGGRGKAMVAEGQVKVDDQPESRKTTKIRAGQIMKCAETLIKVVAGAALTLTSRADHGTKIDGI